jgi:hypothetical protein
MPAATPQRRPPLHPISRTLAFVLPGRWGRLAGLWRDRNTKKAIDAKDASYGSETIMAIASLLPVSWLARQIAEVKEPTGIQAWLNESVKRDPAGFGVRLGKKSARAWTLLPPEKRWHHWKASEIWEIEPVWWEALRPNPDTIFGEDRWEEVVLHRGLTSMHFLDSGKTAERLGLGDLFRNEGHQATERWLQEMDRLWSHRPIEAWSRILSLTDSLSSTSTREDMCNTLAAILPVWYWLDRQSQQERVHASLGRLIDAVFELTNPFAPQGPVSHSNSPQGMAAFVAWRDLLPALKILHERAVLQESLTKHLVSQAELVPQEERVEPPVRTRRRL